MLRRLAQAGIDFMTKHPTKQAGDFNPDSVNAIRAHLRKSGLSAKEASYALIARLALRSWIDALDAGEKIDVRQIRADIETRYASTSITQKQLGIAAGEFTDLPDAIYVHLNAKAQLAPFLTSNRHKTTPNRRLIIYLAVERYARVLPPLSLP